jgi:2-dehydropantoate 2-reductase
VGSCLHNAGVELCFVARSASDRRALQEHGLSRSGIFGEARIEPDEMRLCASIAELRDAPLDFLLVCTKSTASKEVAAALDAVWQTLPETARAVLFQNGWGNAEIFAASLPCERVYNARVITGFRRTQPWAVEVTVHADAIRIGSLFGADSAPLTVLCQAIARGGIPCELSPAIERDLWAKVLYNCLLNPLGALLGVRYGMLGEREETRAIMQAVAEEVFAVLHQSGYRTHWASAQEYLAFFYRELLPATAAHESSMLWDLRTGRATEIDALCGAVVSLGASNRVPTPVNAALAQLIRACERDSIQCR